MAGDSGHRSDRDLELRLRDIAARIDPVPDAVVSRARAAGRTLAPEGSELLELFYDSIVDDTLVDVGVEERIRCLTFVGGGLRLELRLGERPAESGFSAWTAPVRAIDARLATEQETRALAVERDGTIVSPGLPRMPTRVLVVVEITGRIRSFHTSWFSP